MHGYQITVYSAGTIYEPKNAQVVEWGGAEPPPYNFPDVICDCGRCPPY